METPAQREQRIAQLERKRERRRAQGPGRPTGIDVPQPVEIAPGRGDLRFTSWPAEASSAHSLWTIGGRPVSFAKLFTEQPWVAAAVMRMLTWAIRVPLKVYRRDGDDPADRHRLRAGEHPLADAIRNQDGRSEAQLKMELLGPVLVHGNSVTEIENGANDKLRLTAKDWRYAEPLSLWRDSIQGFKFDIDDPSIERQVSLEEVLHIAYWSPMGPLGTSPLQQLGVTLQIEDALQRFTRATFANGARPPSAVEASDEWLGLPRPERQELLDQLRDDLTALYSGPENAGKPALLPPGLEWKALNSSSVEAELVEQRRVDREEVSAVYLIPPPMLGILDKATYSNIKTQREMIYTDCLGPPLILMEQAINAQVVWGLLKEDDVFVEHDFGAVLRGDRLEEIGALREAIGTALFTPNEGRSVINMPRSTSPGMDQFYLPFNNLQPVGAPPIPTLFPTGGGEQPVGKRLHIRSRDRDYELPIEELVPA